MNRKLGFTLLELIIVVSILSALFLLAIAILNPIASIHKAYDAHRKKDLEGLRIAFENYYSDYDCYPTQEQISFCNSDSLDPYMSKIPCDPVSKIPYELVVTPATCPQSYTAYTLLKRDSSCFYVASPNAIIDPNYDCTTYINSNLSPSGTPTPTGTGTPTPPLTGTPTPTSTPTPTPSGNRYCASIDTCSQLPTGKICYPNFLPSDLNCSGFCSNPTNVCTPNYI